MRSIFIFLKKENKGCRCYQGYEKTVKKKDHILKTLESNKRT
jgi:hypothetical protein